jgi:hypothetical protein
VGAIPGEKPILFRSFTLKTTSVHYRITALSEDEITATLAVEDELKRKELEDIERQKAALEGGKSAKATGDDNSADSGPEADAEANAPVPATSAVSGALEAGSESASASIAASANCDADASVAATVTASPSAAPSSTSSSAAVDLDVAAMSAELAGMFAIEDAGWSCTICTYFNALDAARCCVCDGRRQSADGAAAAAIAGGTSAGDSASSAAARAAAASDDATGAAAAVGWWCRFCTYINPLASIRLAIRTILGLFFFFTYCSECNIH